MINIVDKKKCCGCGTCSIICPQKAITMIQDDEGFYYPKIDKKKCIDCKICEKKCPIINKKKSDEENIEFGLGRIIDSSIEKCSSGGIVNAISKIIILKKGCVFGVVFNENWEIIHTKIDNMLDIELINGSKYSQSNLKNTFKECLEELKSGRDVLFIGTPCQIQGLYAFLGRRYENLLTIDMICHGVTSPMIWKDYIRLLEKKYNSKIKYINFRNKDIGYRSTRMLIEFDNGKKMKQSPRTNLYLKLFYNNVINRPSCSQCAFKDKHHISDLTVYDCWNPSKIVKGLKDDNKGYTKVIINTEKGKKILNNKMLNFYYIEENDAIPNGGGMILNSAIESPNRKEFWNDYHKVDKKKAITKYAGVSLKDNMGEVIKEVLHKVGMLDIITKNK